MTATLARMAMVGSLTLLAATGCGGSNDDPQAESDSGAGTGRQESAMKVSSTAFKDGETIPVRFTCDGDDISPPLSITDVPGGGKALALVMDDPDAPGGTWDHWVVYDLPVTSEIAEAADVGTLGRNSWGRNDYGGPCPPDGTHRYVFTLYATDADLDLPAGLDTGQLREAIADHTLAEATLTGSYAR